MSISLGKHDERITALERRITEIGSMVSGSQRGVDMLWSGSHWMDGGAVLRIDNHDFNNYSLIIIHVDADNGDQISDRSNSIICPTHFYGNKTNMWVDLTGDDSAAARLIDNHSIGCQGWSGVWVKYVFGIK